MITLKTVLHKVDIIIIRTGFFLEDNFGILYHFEIKRQNQLYTIRPRCCSLAHVEPGSALGAGSLESGSSVLQFAIGTMPGWEYFAYQTKRA